MATRKKESLEKRKKPVNIVKLRAAMKVQLAKVLKAKKRWDKDVTRYNEGQKALQFEYNILSAAELAFREHPEYDMYREDMIKMNQWRNKHKI